MTRSGPCGAGLARGRVRLAVAGRIPVVRRACCPRGGSRRPGPEPGGCSRPAGGAGVRAMLSRIGRFEARPVMAGPARGAGGAPARQSSAPRAACR
jgi:hypothetical protein